MKFDGLSKKPARCVARAERTRSIETAHSALLLRPRLARRARDLAWLLLLLLGSAGCEAIVDFDREKIDNVSSPPVQLPRYDAMVRPLDAGDSGGGAAADAATDAADLDAGDAGLDLDAQPGSDSAALDAASDVAAPDASELDAADDAALADAEAGIDMDATLDAGTDATLDASDAEPPDTGAPDAEQPDAGPDLDAGDAELDATPDGASDDADASAADAAAE